MIISHKYKFIFIKTAKTAGTSIETFFSPLCDTNDIFTPFSIPERGHNPRNYIGFYNPIIDLSQIISLIGVTNIHRRKILFRELIHNFAKKKKYYHHMPSWQIKNRIGSSIWNNYYKFCVERNPYEKTISGWYWYNYRKSVNISLDQYLQYLRKWSDEKFHCAGIYPVNWLNYTNPINREITINRILRYENLVPSLNEVLDLLGINDDAKNLSHLKGGLRKKNYMDELSMSQKRIIEEIFSYELDLFGYRD